MNVIVPTDVVLVVGSVVVVVVVGSIVTGSFVYGTFVLDPLLLLVPLSLVPMLSLSLSLVHCLGSVVVASCWFHCPWFHYSATFWKVLLHAKLFKV